MRFPSLAAASLVACTRHAGMAFTVTAKVPAAASVIPTRTFAARTALEELTKDGEFKRKEAAWRNWISQEEGAKFPPEKGRYHLYVAYACPWAHRTLLTRALKGLEGVISTTVVHPIWQITKPGVDDHRGWIFGKTDDSSITLTNTKGLGGPFPPAFPGNEPEPVYGASSIRDLYERAGDTDGKYSVPILWDKQTDTIVSNESSEIIRMLNSEFNQFNTNPGLDLYPDDMVDAIEEANDWIFPGLNNGVYRCGFATTQKAYDVAIEELTAAFDKVDSILQNQRYIAGNQLTLADVRLFVTLLRFDEVYQVYFKTNTRSVTRSPAILDYCREIYQLPGVAETVNMEQIKYHYFCSHVELNTYSIVPRGTRFEDLLKQPHNRGQL